MSCASVAANQRRMVRAASMETIMSNTTMRNSEIPSSLKPPIGLVSSHRSASHPGVALSRRSPKCCPSRVIREPVNAAAT
jgi:hypothetical protein